MSVPQDATLSDIKRAYRTESLRWHPDKNKAPEAHKRFQGVAKAYQVLSNEETRAKYDHHRNNQAVRYQKSRRSPCVRDSSSTGTRRARESGL